MGFHFMDPVHSSQILNGLIEISRLGIIAQDSAGTVQVWNRGAERILGWSEEEILGRPAPAALQLLKTTAGEIGLSLSRKDGTIVDVDVCTGPWRDEMETPQGILAIVVEVGRYRTMERKLARVEQELAQVRAQEKETQVEMQAERRFRELLEAAPDAIQELNEESGELFDGAPVAFARE